MPVTALDIGTQQIKALTGKGGLQPQIEKAIISPNQSGLAYAKDEGDAEKLLQTLDKVFRDNKLPREDVRLSLPEEIVTTKIINLPPLTNAELASAIDWQAEQHIPVPLENLSLEYQVLYRPPKKEKDQPMRVLLVGTHRDTVELYTDIFFNLGIQPKTMETQIFSMVRALGFEPEDPVTMIIHIGASNTQLAIINQTEISLASSKTGGGVLFTRAIQQAIENLERQQAKEYKHAYGLDANQLQGKIRQAILPGLNSIGQEVKKALQFHNNQYPNQLVKRIVLCGGSANIPGLIEYFTKLTGIEVLRASPFAPASGNIPQENQQEYIVTMGLMMRK